MAAAGIDGALRPMPAARGHLRALPYWDAAAALDLIEASRASLAAKSCLRLVVLTACRSGEARGATWDEIDWEGREWRIPRERMKSDVEHRVPLSGAALAALERMRPLASEPAGWVFPSPVRPARPLSDMALTKVLRDTGLADRTVVHGFGSAFRSWAAERTRAPHAVAEMALAHAVGSDVERSDARSDLFGKRRELMDTVGGVCDRRRRASPARLDRRRSLVISDRRRPRTGAARRSTPRLPAPTIERPAARLGAAWGTCPRS